jgi:hypothetical protein
MAVKLPETLNLLTNPLANGDVVRLPDGDWEVANSMAGWYLRKPGTTDNHPAVTACAIGHSQAALLAAVFGLLTENEDDKDRN